MSEPILSIRGLQRTYVTAAGSLPVLRGVDLDVAAGEIVGLIGPSGSGKSSLLHAAGLLEHPDGGRITIEGRDCSDLSDKVRTRVRARSGRCEQSVPRMLIRPPSGCSSSPAACSRLDLPEPEGPTRPTISPGATSRSAPFSTGSPPAAVT